MTYRLILPAVLFALIAGCTTDAPPPRDSRNNVPSPGLAPIDDVLSRVPPTQNQQALTDAQTARANALRARAARLREVDMDQQ